MDLVELGVFLKEANKATYANKEARKAAPLRPGSEDYHFEQGDLAYHDTYFGGRDFIGEEIVYKAGKVVWGMNYYGHILKDGIPTDEAYAILRPALMEEYDDIIPVRGPREYTEGAGIYRNEVQGDLGRFSGTEEIYLNDELVSRCWYHGGFIT